MAMAQENDGEDELPDMELPSELVAEKGFDWQLISIVLRAGAAFHLDNTNIYREREIERERWRYEGGKREREKKREIYIYIYISIHVYILRLASATLLSAWLTSDEPHLSSNGAW